MWLNKYNNSFRIARPNLQKNQLLVEALLDNIHPKNLVGSWYDATSRCLDAAKIKTDDDDDSGDTCQISLECTVYMCTSLATWYTMQFVHA